MKNLNLTFVAIIFALFALTSCEKESMTEMAQGNASEIMERKLPAAGDYTGNDAAKTQATQKSLGQLASSRTIGFERISDFSNAIHRTTFGQGNSMDQKNAPCLDAYTDKFDGPDAGFYFEVEYDSGFLPDVDITYEITLSNLRADLDLFVYTVDQNGYISQCKKRSMTHGATDEKINLGELNKGTYVILVDGWAAHVAGDFTLKVDKKEAYTYGPGDGDNGDGGPILPSNGDSESMSNARFVDFLGGHADTHDDGWVVIRGDQIEFFEDYSATSDVLTLTSTKVEGDKITDIKITINKTTNMVTSKTKWRKQYSSGSSGWSASIRDIDYKG